MAAARFGSYVSSDSHVTEPPEAYAGIDPKFRGRAPVLKHLPDMGATAVVDPGGQAEAFVPFGRMAAAGRVLQGGEEGWSWEELHPGGYDAEARIEEQTRDGFAAEVVYPSVGMVLCGHPDGEYKKACFDAYNEWLAEWCSYAPGRLLGVGQTAMRTPDEAVRDLESIKELGLRGVMLPAVPGFEDYDHEAYDEFWSAAEEMELPVSFHIFTGDARWRGPNLNGFLGIIHGNQDILGMLILSGVFERHPGLRVVCVEADAGWAPHYMFRMDTLYQRHHKWVLAAGLTREPSQYFRENIYLTFQDDAVAFEVLDLLNVERLMWANDHPHSDATWPRSQEVLEANMSDVKQEWRDRIVRDNCAELYGIAV